MGDISDSGLSRLDKCKLLVERYFGPSVLSLVDRMEKQGKTEQEIIDDCRKKARAFLGEERAKEFDNI